jgi:hypothetical protein
MQYKVPSKTVRCWDIAKGPDFRYAGLTDVRWAAWLRRQQIAAGVVEQYATMINFGILRAAVQMLPVPLRVYCNLCRGSFTAETR